MAEPTIRPYRAGDAVEVARVLVRCFGRLESWTEERVAALAPAPDSATDAFWVAFEGQRASGCVRAFTRRQPGGYVVRELAAVGETAGALMDELLDVALAHLARLRARHIRASTPLLPTYPEAYRRRGFSPVRRALTLTWNLAEPTAPVAVPESVTIGDGLRHPPARLAELYVEGMRPYWDWFIEEAGGAEPFKARAAAFIASLPPGEDDQLWLTAEVGGEAVGLAYVTDLGAAQADMGGVYVMPSHRGRGIGTALMHATLTRVRRRASLLVVPETVTGLEGDLPSVRLYKRSGARVRAEYLHLQGRPVGASGAARAGAC